MKSLILVAVVILVTMVSVGDCQFPCHYPNQLCYHRAMDGTEWSIPVSTNQHSNSLIYGAAMVTKSVMVLE